MKLKEEANKIFTELLGPSIARQLDCFDDAEKYPQDFLNQCRNFMAQMIGESAAEERLAPLFRKYAKKR